MKTCPETCKIQDAILCTVDTSGVSVINKETRHSTFISYPEAAVWLVMIEGHSHRKNIQLLSAILKKNLNETEDFLDCCLTNWKNMNLMV